MKLAGPRVVLVAVATGKLFAMPAKTAPVGPPSTVTTSGLIASGPLLGVAYSVDRSVPLSATHQGLVVALRVSPQALTRCGSVSAAAPGTSETSGVTV
jgi:hypothetical protein